MPMVLTATGVQKESQLLGASTPCFASDVNWLSLFLLSSISDSSEVSFARLCSSGVTVVKCHPLWVFTGFASFYLSNISVIHRSGGRHLQIVLGVSWSVVLPLCQGILLQGCVSFQSPSAPCLVVSLGVGLSLADIMEPTAGYHFMNDSGCHLAVSCKHEWSDKCCESHVEGGEDFSAVVVRSCFGMMTLDGWWSSTQAQPSTSWCTNRQLLEDMGIHYPAPHNLISHMLLQDGNSALSSAGLRFWMQQGIP